MKGCCCCCSICPYNHPNLIKANTKSSGKIDLKKLNKEPKCQMKTYKKLYHPIETGKRPLDTNWTGVDIYQKKQQAL